MEQDVLLWVLVITASVLIPVRLFLATAVVFDFAKLPEKFKQMLTVLLPLDLLWAVSPFTGLALAMSAALVYLPFTQRSLMLMYGRTSSQQR